MDTTTQSREVTIPGVGRMVELTHTYPDGTPGPIELRWAEKPSNRRQGPIVGWAVTRFAVGTALLAVGVLLYAT